MQFLRTFNLTPKKLFIGLPILLVMLYFIASFFLQATTQTEMDDEQASLKRDYDAVIRHHIVVRGSYLSETGVSDNYTLNILDDRSGEGIWFYACHPLNVEETKERLAPVRKNFEFGIMTDLLVFGRVKKSAPIRYERLEKEEIVIITLVDCRIIDFK